MATGIWSVYQTRDKIDVNLRERFTELHVFGVVSLDETRRESKLIQILLETLESKVLWFCMVLISI